MKQFRFLLFSSVALLCLASVAANKKVVKMKKVKAKKAVVDTCSVDTFSYAVGMANTQGLKNYLVTRMNIDTLYMDDFLNGLSVDSITSVDKKLQAYTAGLQIRQQVNSQIIPSINHQMTDNDSVHALNKKLFVKGFSDAIKGHSTLMSMQKADELTQKQMEYYKEVINEKKYGSNRKDGEAFLKANAKKDSVIARKDGLQYKILVKGSGPVPSDTSTVKVNYEGKLIDGTIFDSSYKRKKPATFKCNQVIKGWTEALKLMPVGSKWEIFVPEKLGYGAREAGKIKPYSTLIFTVELLEIEK